MTATRSRFTPNALAIAERLGNRPPPPPDLPARGGRDIDADSEDGRIVRSVASAHPASARAGETRTGTGMERHRNGRSASKR
jgi:hypothetical protein